MTTTTTPTATAKTAKQLVIAVSDRVKTWTKDTAASYSAPSKSKDVLFASEREVMDALVNLVELHRYQQAPTMEIVTIGEGEETEEHEIQSVNPETGELVFHEVDLFEIEIEKVMAERMENTRTNSSTAKIAEKENEIAELKAMIAKLQGGTSAPDAAPAGE